MPGTKTAARSQKTSADQDILEMAASLRLSATRLARRLRRESDTGLTPSQLSALAAIERHGPLTLGALADHERVSPPSITKVVNKLESQDLIAREVDPNDRRIWRVATTSAGNELLEEARARKNAWLAARLGELTRDERSRLAAAIEVLDQLTTRDPMPNESATT